MVVVPLVFCGPLVEFEDLVLVVVVVVFVVVVVAGFGPLEKLVLLFGAIALTSCLYCLDWAGIVLEVVSVLLVIFCWLPVGPLLVVVFVIVFWPSPESDKYSEDARDIAYNYSIISLKQLRKATGMSYDYAPSYTVTYTLKDKKTM